MVTGFLIGIAVSLLVGVPLARHREREALAEGRADGDLHDVEEAVGDASRRRRHEEAADAFWSNRKDNAPDDGWEYATVEGPRKGDDPGRPRRSRRIPAEYALEEMRARVLVGLEMGDR